MAEHSVRIGGPYFEDFTVGQVFDDAPSLTITAGHAALHQAILGDRMRMPLDAALTARVTGHAAPGPVALAHPQLVCDVSIGQSTGASERALANLFYRGLVLNRQVFVGDTLTSRAHVVALKQNRTRTAGVATGLVALRIQTVDQHDRIVLDYWRCPMLPLRDEDAQTSHLDPITGIPEQLDHDALHAAVPSDWDYAHFRTLPGAHSRDLRMGTAYHVEARETVTSAPELARLSLNIARTHTDAGASGRGRRLVYGGHTIGIAAAGVTRALPNLMTILAWDGCDHVGPVFEGDILSTSVSVTRIERARYADAGLVWLRATVTADRADGTPPAPVLDWRLVALMA